MASIILKLNKDLKARYLCLQILIGVFQKRKTVAQTLDNQSYKAPVLEESEVARAERISNFIFSHLIGIDDCINLYLRKKIKLEVRNILRLVVAELIIKESPDHAIVNSAVKLSKLSLLTKYFSGLVNAISRKIVLQIRNKNLILRASLDKKIREYLYNIYSDSVIHRIEELMSVRAPIDLTVKNFNEINFWKKELNAIELPTGTLRLHNSPRLSSLQGFKEGQWWVQGVSSSIPVKILGNVAGKEVLDLFSAPGGKAMQLISAGAKVTCLDSSYNRLKILRKNFARMQMTAKVINTDALKFQTKKKYDIIIIDAPCSASGTIIKNKDLMHLDPLDRMPNLMKIQSYSLNVAKKLIKDDGIMIYCTCSLFPSEGEEQISKFLSKNPNWKQKMISPQKLGLEKKWVDVNGGLRLRPDFLFELGGADGFFIAILSKTN